MFSLLSYFYHFPRLILIFLHITSFQYFLPNEALSKDHAFTSVERSMALDDVSFEILELYESTKPYLAPSDLLRYYHLRGPSIEIPQAWYYFVHDPYSVSFTPTPDIDQGVGEIEFTIYLNPNQLSSQEFFEKTQLDGYFSKNYYEDPDFLEVSQVSLNGYEAERLEHIQTVKGEGTAIVFNHDGLIVILRDLMNRHQEDGIFDQILESLELEVF